MQVRSMTRNRIIIAVLIIGVISLTSYMYFRKQPIESTPERATLVHYLQNQIEKEVEIIL